MDSRPIGIFDSGIGGLTIWQEIASFLPGESLIYFADQAYFPYGEKSNREIKARAEKICQFLIKKNVKLIVIACNTATVSAIDFLRKKFSLSFIGSEPAIKPATQITKTGVIGVLATRKTVKSRRQKNLIDSLAWGKEVISLDCSELTPLIEKGEIDSPKTLEVLRKYLLPLKRKKIDVLVLACTHYPFLKKQIQNIIGLEVKIIDSGKAIAKQVKRVLEENNLSSDQRKAKKQFFTTGDPKEFQIIANKFLGFPIKVNTVNL